MTDQEKIEAEDNNTYDIMLSLASMATGGRGAGVGAIYEFDDKGLYTLAAKIGALVEAGDVNAGHLVDYDRGRTKESDAWDEAKKGFGL